MQELPGTSVSSHRNGSEDPECDPGTGLGIGQGVVVVLQVKAAGSRDGVELVVGKAPPEDPARSRQVQ